jgi:hypothetical protein
MGKGDGMSLQTPAGLEQSVENLRLSLGSAIRDLESLKGRLAALEAAFNGHRHTLSITATATTTGTDSVGGNINATTTVSATGTAGTPR